MNGQTFFGKWKTNFAFPIRFWFFTVFVSTKSPESDFRPWQTIWLTQNWFLQVWSIWYWRCSAFRSCMAFFRIRRCTRRVWPKSSTSWRTVRWKRMCCLCARREWRPFYRTSWSAWVCWWYRNRSTWYRFPFWTASFCSVHSPPF